MYHVYTIVFNENGSRIGRDIISTSELSPTMVSLAGSHTTFFPDRIAMLASWNIRSPSTDDRQSLIGVWRDWMQLIQFSQ